MDAGLSSGLSVPEAGISVVTTMAHTLQSVSTEATEKEKELEELQIDIKELLVELQAAAVQQLDSTVSDQAAVELAWQRDLASLRVDKSYIMGVLRDLYEDLDETFHAMSTSEMMAHGVLLVSTQITEKELQLEAVREQRKAVREHLNAVRAQLKAAASESDDRDPALVQPDQSGWDKARARRASQTYSVVQECLREDQQYIHDVLKFLRRMQNTLKTQERMQRLIRGPSPLHAEPVTDVARRLPHFIAPNPVYGKGLSKRRFGDNLVPAAVRKLYSFRHDARATGFVTGPPGRGKTLLLLLLLLSVIEEPDLVMSLTPEVLDWWARLPVYVLSFNGITKATVGDHVLAAIDLGLPGLLRIIYAESWDPRTTGYQFSTYRDDVSKMLIDGQTSVAAVKATAATLVQARVLPASADGMRGLLLVDELPHYSLAALPKDEREALLTLRKRCKRGMDVLRLMYKSIDILAQHPVVMAVGLLNYDAPSSGFLTEQLSWNTVFGTGALLHRSSGQSKTRNPTIIVTFFLAALSAWLHRVPRSTDVGAAIDVLPAPDNCGGRTELEDSEAATDADGKGEEDDQEDSVVAAVIDVSGDDGGVYAACDEVRRALLVGDVPVSWENLFLWTEVLLSCCRALLCRNQA
eukprot:contig_16319_g3951